MPERRPWSAEQDNILKHLKEQQQISKWSLIAKKMSEQYSMPDRTGKQCRQRYHNHLDSTILRAEWTPEQQQHLYKLHDEIGNKWAIIAQKLPGRTDNCVKNHFYSKMRKAIRKLNKIIYQYYKKEIKEIKMNVLYKIVQATDEKFKANSSVEQQTSQKCCKLKNLLLLYSTDGSELQNDIEKIGEIAVQINEFSSKYRRKTKKTRRSSVQASDLLKIPKFEAKVKSSSDCDNDSEYSMVFSHDNQQQQEDSEQVDDRDRRKPLEDIEEVQDLKQSTNSKIIRMPQVNLVEAPTIRVNKTLMKPPPLIKPPMVAPNNLIGNVEQGQRLQQFLRNKGLVESEIQSPLVIIKNSSHPLHKIANLVDSVRSMEDEGKNSVNFLSTDIIQVGESIQKMKIHDINFQVQVDEEHKLFVSND